MARTTKTLMIGAALSVALSTSAFAQDGLVGRNSAVKGSVTIATDGGPARAAIVRDPVLLGDDVASAAASSLQVLLLDETVFTVGPEAQMTIDRFVYDPSRADNGLTANVKSGMFRFMSGKTTRSGPNAVAINTPVASLGVRGTIVEGLVGMEAIAIARQLGLIDPSQVVDPAGATLFVLRGPGPAKSSRDSRGEIVVSSTGGTVVLNRPGQAVFVANSDAAPIGPFDMSRAASAVFDEKLRTTPTAGSASYRPFDVDVDVPVIPRRRTDNPSESFDPAVELDWPSESDSLFDSPCGPDP